jgi:RNA polymerase sigma-70 factor (ECF subfamily)
LALTESIPNYAQTDPDVRLMLQVQNDDPAAFEELVERYQTRLLHLLEHLIHRKEQAEDLVQEVFLRVYRARKSYTVQAKFSTWLFTIANNVANNALRKLSRRKEVNVVGSANGENANPMNEMALAASGLMPARQFDKAEMSDVVRLAVQALSERQRTALLLSRFEHLSYAEIAAVMELTPQAIKSLLSRARGNLKTILEPYFQEGSSP